MIWAKVNLNFHNIKHIQYYAFCCYNNYCDIVNDYILPFNEIHKFIGVSVKLKTQRIKTNDINKFKLYNHIIKNYYSFVKSPINLQNEISILNIVDKLIINNNALNFEIKFNNRITMISNSDKYAIENNRVFIEFNVLFIIGNIVYIRLTKIMIYSYDYYHNPKKYKNEFIEENVDVITTINMTDIKKHNNIYNNYLEYSNEENEFADNTIFSFMLGFKLWNIDFINDIKIGKCYVMLYV